MVRMKRSIDSVDLPANSDNRPDPTRRWNSICQSRSWAWRKPRAKTASSMLRALIWGTSFSSRMTVTSPESPCRARRPSVSGRLVRSQITPITTAAITMKTRPPRIRPIQRMKIPASCRQNAAESVPRHGGSLMEARLRINLCVTRRG